jgi:hypothetical protein
MEDNPLSIDLKKLRKAPPPVSVAPLSTTPVAPRVQVTPPVAPAQSPPPRPMYSTGSTPSRRRMKWLPKTMPKLSLLQYIVFGVILLAVLGGGYYIYVHVWTQSPFGPTPASAASTSDTSAGQEDTAAAAATSTLDQAAIIARVGKIMLLPDGEEPSLAGVSDLNALKDQSFFKNAKVGDIVLMYPKAARAILYDPVANKIIEVGPITTDATSTTPSAKK